MMWLPILTAFLLSVSAEIPQPERSYKILMLLPISTESQRIIFVSLAEALADRGHKVVMLTNNQNDPIATESIHEFTHGMEELRLDDQGFFDRSASATAGEGEIREVLSACAERLYATSKINELYRKRKIFDVVILDGLLNEVMYPFAHELPFITISSAGLVPRQSAQLGNYLNPAYIPFMQSGLQYPMGILQRFMNLAYYFGFFASGDSAVSLSSAQAQLSKRFPKLPPLLDIERNQSLTLVNTHFSLSSSASSTAVPLLPSQVEVGGMHCRLPQQLPQDLEEWIEGSGSNGVIYISLGSNLGSSSKRIILEALGRLKQRVLWKSEGEMEEVPSNVLVRSRFPQQDILGHLKVKAFVTYGDLLSFQEAVYHATPVLIMPHGQEQFKYAQTAIDEGVGLALRWDEINSADQVVDALLTILQNSKYQENIDEMSLSFRDRLESPLDRAIYWTEYVIRHRGAPSLRSPAADISLVQLLLLDALVVFLLIIATTLFLLKLSVKKLLDFCKRKLGFNDDGYYLPLISKEKLT